MSQHATTSRSQHAGSSSSTTHFLAGLTTGILSASLLQPADLLKTRLQQDSSRTRLLPTIRHILSSSSSAGAAGVPQNSSVAVLRGWRSLWRGTLPSVLRTGFGSALYFSTLNYLRTGVASLNANTNNPRLTTTTTTTKTTPSRNNSSSTLPPLSPTANLLTGALARSLAGFAMMPATVIKVRYESTLYAHYTSLAGAAQGIWAQEGVKGFWSGAGATMVRDAPYAGVFVGVYEACKGLAGGGKKGEGKEGMGAGKSMAVNFTSGVIAAVVATALTNPFDAVKTRVQLCPGRYGNMVRAGGMMVREEGWRSLFDGMGLRVGRKAVSSALAWMGYEELVRRVGVGVVGG